MLRPSGRPTTFSAAVEMYRPAVRVRPRTGGWSLHLTARPGTAIVVADTLSELRDLAGDILDAVAAASEGET